MFRKALKWTFGILAILLVALSIFLINLIWFRPWSLNLFYEKVFAQTVFDEPELLSSLGLVEQFGITSHNGKLSDASPAHQQKVADRWRSNLEDLHEYPLSRQTDSQRLSTHVLDWFLQRQVEGEKYQLHNYPVNQLFGVQNEFPSFMANTHRLLAPRDCDYYLQRLDALPDEVRSIAREPEAARGETDSAAAFRGREGAEGDDCVRRHSRPPENILASFVQDARRKDQRT